MTYVSGDGALDGRLSCMNAYTRYKQRAHLENLDPAPRCQIDLVVMELHPRCLPPSERWRQTVQHQLTRPCRRKAHALTRLATENREKQMWPHAG